MNISKKRLGIAIICVFILLFSTFALTACSKPNNNSNNNSNNNNNNNDITEPTNSYEIQESIWDNIINKDFLINNSSSFTMTAESTYTSSTGADSSKKTQTIAKKQNNNWHFYTYDSISEGTQNAPIIIENYFTKDNDKTYIFKFSKTENSWIKEEVGVGYPAFTIERDIALSYLYPIFREKLEDDVDEEEVTEDVKPIPFSTFTFNNNTNEYERIFESLIVDRHGTQTQIENVICKIKFNNNKLLSLTYSGTCQPEDQALSEEYVVTLNNVASTTVTLPENVTMPEYLQVDSETWSTEFQALFSNHNFSFLMPDATEAQKVYFDGNKIFDGTNYYLLNENEKTYKYSQVESNNWIKEEILNENFEKKVFITQLNKIKPIISNVCNFDKFNFNVDTYSIYKSKIELDINNKATTLYQLEINVRFKNNKLQDIKIKFKQSNSDPYKEYLITNINSSIVNLPIISA